MMRQDHARIDPKRRATVDPKRRQFATSTFKPVDYPHRLNLYETPPTAEITLEQFEQWAIDRLRGALPSSLPFPSSPAASSIQANQRHPVLAELEACSYRNKTATETASHIKPLLDKYLQLESNSSGSSLLPAQRQKDHYSHFILRLAFSGTDDLRRRFARVETMLFRIRFQQDDARERQAFVQSLNLDWDPVPEHEKREWASELLASTPGGVRRVEDESWFKLDWERVPELVESRRVFLRHGKAYVPIREQASMVVSEFTTRLERGLELTSRALPRLDEDDRLSPILNHLSKNFSTPPSFMADASSPLEGGAPMTASSIDALSVHFPLCMRHLHGTLRQNAHLKHFGRLQYTLFLKGIGLNLEECLIFWRTAFKNHTDDVFNKEYRYNVRHVYGDVGGDANRRGRGYSPYSCQKILTEHAPGPGEAHGCPYRHFSADNLVAALQRTVGVTDRDTLRAVRDDVAAKRYHIACNRVFEAQRHGQIKRVKDDGSWNAADLDTIVHPNTYFRRSYQLATHTAQATNGDGSGSGSGSGNGNGEAPGDRMVE